MCEPSREILAAAANAGTPTATRRHRLKLWEIDSRLHCSVVGTCLRISDMRQLCRRVGIDIEPSMTDYELHHAFVQSAAGPSPLARQIQKLLDRRYANVLSRFARAKDHDARRQVWDECREAGEVPAAYWAVLTHPAAEPALVDFVAGEVHMLSHLMGASRHADRRRLETLERQNEEQARHLTDLRQTLHQRTEDKNRELIALRDELMRSRCRVRELETERQRLMALESERAGTRQQRENERLAAALIRRERDVSELRDEVEQWKASLETLRQRNDQLEQALLRGGGVKPPTAACSRGCASDADVCPQVDLCGKCILYVGGRASLSPHLAALVGRCNGRWLEHDGGREDTPARLQQLLPRADAVICPVDCVSHDAVRRVKAFCKQNAKRLVLLQSASLSSLARGLEELAPANAPEAGDTPA